MKVYTFLTDGFETVEALAVIDILRRAGIEVETVSITGNEQVCSAQNITIKADTLFKAQPVRKEDVLFLPGGPGHKQYNECKPLLELLERHHAEGGRIAAICAAPSILGPDRCRSAYSTGKSGDGRQYYNGKRHGGFY